MNVERLFTDPEFDKLIKWHCFKRGLNPNEMRQEVFAEIIDSGAETLAECRKIADRITQEHRRTIDEIESHETIYAEDGEDYRGTSNMYWRGVDPRMNEDVDPELAWT